MPRTLSDEELKSRLDEARDRERRAREAAARLKRAMVERDRRMVSQRKFVLGAAVLAWAEADPRIVPPLRRFLAGFVRRDGDWDALDGTPFARPGRDNAVDGGTP